MALTTLSSREFNQDTSRTKESLCQGAPCFITDRGKPAHVLLSMEEYQRLSGQGRNILDALSMPGLAGIEFDPPKLQFREASGPLLSTAWTPGRPADRML